MHETFHLLYRTRRRYLCPAVPSVPVLDLTSDRGELALDPFLHRDRLISLYSISRTSRSDIWRQSEVQGSIG